MVNTGVTLVFETETEVMMRRELLLSHDDKCVSTNHLKPR